MEEIIINFIVNHWKEIVIAYGLKTVVIAGYIIWRKFKDQIVINNLFHEWVFNEFKFRTLIALH